MGSDVAGGVWQLHGKGREGVVVRAWASHFFLLWRFSISMNPSRAGKEKFKADTQTLENATKCYNNFCHVAS